MSTLTFDTMQYMDDLKKGGMTQEQAEAITKAISNALSQLMETKDISTKRDLQTLKMELQGFIVKSLTTTAAVLGGIQVLFHFVK